jgi:hypothetical protein
MAARLRLGLVMDWKKLCSYCGRIAQIFDLISIFGVIVQAAFSFAPIAWHARDSINAVRAYEVPTPGFQ